MQIYRSLVEFERWFAVSFPLGEKTDSHFAQAIEFFGHIKVVVIALNGAHWTVFCPEAFLAEMNTGKIICAVTNRWELNYVTEKQQTDLTQYFLHLQAQFNSLVKDVQDSNYFDSVYRTAKSSEISFTKRLQ